MLLLKLFRYYRNVDFTVCHDMGKKAWKAVWQERLRATTILRFSSYHTCISRENRACATKKTMSSSIDLCCMCRKEVISKMDGKRLLRNGLFKNENELYCLWNHFHPSAVAWV